MSQQPEAEYVGGPLDGTRIFTGSAHKNGDERWHLNSSSTAEHLYRWRDGKWRYVGARKFGSKSER